MPSRFWEGDASRRVAALSGSAGACHPTESSVRNSDTKFRAGRRAWYSSTRWILTLVLGVNFNGARDGSPHKVGFGPHDTARSQRLGHFPATRPAFEHGSRPDEARPANRGRSGRGRNGAPVPGLWATFSGFSTTAGVGPRIASWSSALGGRAHSR